ncbi:MAG: MnhB domain-containing protein [Thermoplasmata archaeon]
MSSIVVKTAGRALAPFILIYGVYVTLFGSWSPGGGFQGGVLLASGIMLILITHSQKEIQRLAQDIDWFETFGAFVFLIVGLLGLLLGGAFFSNLWPGSPTMFIILDIVISLKVFAGIVALSIFFFGVEVKTS